MAAPTASGDDTVISFGPGWQLVLEGVDKASLTDKDFVFA